MLLKVATTVTLIVSCLGHAPIYDERSSNEAISTQSFNRDDIPISYKYTSIHVYSTQKPIDEDDVIRPQGQHNSEYHAVQYAPLVENTTKNSTRYTKVVVDPNNIAKEPSTIENDKLEPRKQPASTGDVAKAKYFVSGHNIEVKRSPNRNAGYNAIYQSRPENLKSTLTEITDYNLGDYVKPQTSSKGNEHTKSFRAFKELKQEPFAWMFEHKPRPEKYVYYKGERNVQPNRLNPLPSHHTHRMQINVARINGHAQIIGREIIIGDTLKNLEKPQKHSHRKGALGLNGDQRTLLYPLHKRQTYLKS
ncbi:uncharacterized protein LOC119191598 [Manduca sexta]|uniref:Uncharacterized protein n=1 Tax=Manduca sexta TaxID=7130 RepID=A0A921ZZV3_MANSE|nr:uncharacterized protein LOC115453896 [Manduca sexta]XP_037301383.1 uncharacterized protein LOC119191598 [Manduca sexta]KAG6465503.1 hypothetical protein O3G_MSEX015196 [Manduca sexta]